MWSIDFWTAVCERGIKTLAQSAAAALIAAGTGIIETDWIGILSISLMAAVVSVLTSIGTGAVTGTPSATGSEQVMNIRDADIKIGGTDE